MLLSLTVVQSLVQCKVNHRLLSSLDGGLAYR